MSKCAFCCMGCPNPHRKLGKLITRHRSLQVPKASRVTSRASDSFYVDLAVSWMLHRGLAGDASSCCPKTRHVSVNPSFSLFVPCDVPLLGGYPYSQHIPQYDVVVFTSCSTIPHKIFTILPCTQSWQPDLDSNGKEHGKWNGVYFII